MLQGGTLLKNLLICTVFTACLFLAGTTSDTLLRPRCHRRPSTFRQQSKPWQPRWKPRRPRPLRLPLGQRQRALLPQLQGQRPPLQLSLNRHPHQFQPRLQHLYQRLPRPPQLRPLPTPTPLPIPTVRLYGTASGAIVHDPDDGCFETFRGPDIDGDVMVEVNFLNPYSVSTGRWEYGFYLRGVSNLYQRVSVQSTGAWEHDYRLGPDTSATSLRSESSPDIERGASGRNQLRLVIVGQEGWFCINGKLQDKLDLGVAPFEDARLFITYERAGEEHALPISPFGSAVGLWRNSPTRAHRSRCLLQPPMFPMCLYMARSAALLPMRFRSHPSSSSYSTGRQLAKT